MAVAVVRLVPLTRLLLAPPSPRANSHTPCARFALCVAGGRTARSAPSSGGEGRSASQARIHPLELSPDLDCLSWTHDHDYEDHRPLPPAALALREKRKVEIELMELASRATDEHISKLSPAHQPWVRLLRTAAQQMPHHGAQHDDGAARAAPPRPRAGHGAGAAATGGAAAQLHSAHQHEQYPFISTLEEVD